MRPLYINKNKSQQKYNFDFSIFPNIIEIPFISNSMYGKWQVLCQINGRGFCIEDAGRGAEDRESNHWKHIRNPDDQSEYGEF